MAQRCTKDQPYSGAPLNAINKASLGVHLQSQAACPRALQAEAHFAVFTCSLLVLEQIWSRLVKCKSHSMSVALRRQVLQDRERMKAHAVGKAGLKMLLRWCSLGFLPIQRCTDVVCEGKLAGHSWKLEARMNTSQMKDANGSAWIHVDLLCCMHDLRPFSLAFGRKALVTYL